MNRKLTLDITIIVSCLAGMLLSYAYLEDPVKRMTSLAREQIEVIAEDATGQRRDPVCRYIEKCGIQG